MQTIYTCSYYLRNRSKQFLRTTTGEIIANKLKSFYEWIISNNIHTYILLSKKSFQTNLRNYCKRNNCKQYWQTITRESFQTILRNYCHKNHSKQFLHTITREIIANHAYKRLSDDSGHFKKYFLFIAHNTDSSFKAIIRKFITNNAFNSCLNPATSKAKGHITYQNTNFRADYHNYKNVSNYGEHSRFLVKHYK